MYWLVFCVEDSSVSRLTGVTDRPVSMEFMCAGKYSITGAKYRTVLHNCRHCVESHAWGVTSLV